MKYLIVIPDGLADEPQDSLGGLTPVEYAKTPNLDRLASRGVVGFVQTVPQGYAPGSDVAILSILGYDCRKHYTGRGPIEAWAQAVPARDDDVIYRANLVSCDGTRLTDYSAGHVTTEEARALVKSVAEKLEGDRFRFFPGISYRHLLLWKAGPDGITCTPPHDIMGQEVAKYLPQGENAKPLRGLVWDSMEILDTHDINKRRLDQGLAPANMVWPWGQGRKLSLPSFSSRFGKTAAVITAVDLIRGVAKAAAMETIEVPGATGYYDTNYQGKAEAASRSLRLYDLVLVHVEATDEAGHNGHLEEKIRAMENIDAKILGPVTRALDEGKEDWALLLLPDHPTPVRLRTHVREPVPFLYYRSFHRVHNDLPYSEKSLSAAATFIAEGKELMGRFLTLSL